MKDNSGYKGDSLGKKCARVYFWFRVTEYLYDMGLEDGKIAYLASREGGDASILKALGWPEENQLAIDCDEGALAAFSEKFPNVPVAFGSVDKVLSSRNEKFSAIYLDLCSNITKDSIDLISKCVPHVVDNGRFAYCLMRGREKKEVSEKIISYSKDRKTYFNKMEAAFGKEFPEQFVKLKEDYSELVGRLSDGRSDLCQISIQNKINYLRIAIPHNTSIFYHSVTKDAQGVPMMIEDYKVKYYGRGIDKNRFEYLWKKDKQQEFAAAILNNSLIEDPSSFQTLITKPFLTLDLNGVKIGNLLDLSYEIENQNFDAAMALNVSKGTLAAWRAHDTRKPYEYKGISTSQV